MIQATLRGGGGMRAGTIFGAQPPCGWEPHHVKLAGWNVRCLSLSHKEVRREPQIVSTPRATPGIEIPWLVMLSLSLRQTLSLSSCPLPYIKHLLFLGSGVDTR